MSIHKASKRDLFFCKWRDEDGKEKRRYFKTEQEAHAFEAERLQARTQEEERLTLGELTMLFCRSRHDLNIVTKRKIVYFLAGYEKDGIHHAGTGEFLRDKYAEALTRQDLERMREAFRTRAVGNNTINKFQALVRAILAWGVDQELIRFNPWRDFKKLKVTRPVFQPKIEDLKKLYPELPEYLQWAVKTAFFLALRPGQVELFGLTWDAFNWRRGVVIVRQGKSGRLKTVVPHPAYMEEARCRFEKDMAAGIPWVCHRGKGQRVLNFRTAWTLACKRAGVTLRPYDIRHIAATEMLARGADLAAVAAQLGHSSVATTGAVYAHVTEGSQAHAGALMPALGEPLKNGDTNGDTW